MFLKITTLDYWVDNMRAQIDSTYFSKKTIWQLHLKKYFNKNCSVMDA